VKVYITGIAGFLGSHLADWLLAQGQHRVWGCDNLVTGDFRNIPYACSSNVAKLDILDIRPVDMYGCDVVYHCAAAAYEGASVFAPGYVCENIFAGSARVFSAAIEAGVRRIVFCSSMARYGDIGPPFNESDCPRPCDPYGIAKEAAERLLRSLAHVHHVEYAIAVPHNIYGPRQRYTDPYRNVAAIFANRMLQGKQPIIYGDGSHQRCFSYIDDVVPYLGMMGIEDAAVWRTINLGPDEGMVTILELAQMISRLVNMPCDPIFLPGRPAEVPDAYCSAATARRCLGFGSAPQTSLEDGLRHLVDFIRKRGPAPFRHHLGLEIHGPSLPTTWTTKDLM